jgi:hypothetical protein
VACRSPPPPARLDPQAAFFCLATWVAIASMRGGDRQS